MNIPAPLPISVIIPTLNAERTLLGTLEALGAVAHCVVVDGGSTDATQAVATAAGAQVLTTRRGRGLQIAAGIAAACSDWLLILHADTRLQTGWRDEAAVHMRDHPDRAAYFRFALDSAHRRARRLEAAVAWRCRVLALPYGDQGLLINRNLMRHVGGMRSLPLMEDVDLIRRIGRRRLRMLEVAAKTSPQRYRRGGYWRRPARNLLCLGLYYLGLPPRFLARLYG